MLAKALQSAAGNAAEATDPQFPYVTMLLHGDGTNGAQNNTFVDSSTNNFAISRNGNTTQGSFSPYGSNWSNYFDGSGDYLTFPNNAAFAFGTGPFTVEFWVNSIAVSDSFILSGRAAVGTMHITYGGFGGSTAGSLRYVGSSTITSGSTLISNSQWNHCAIVRDGSNNITLYVNGASVGTGTDTTNYTTTSGTWYINANDSGPTPGQAGYISNLRVVKGTAVYTSAFTPSTTPLTAITNTSLLTCQSNRFIDTSANNFTITANGGTSVQRFSPFAPTAEYSASVIGGSGYFDGTGDYLQTTSSQVIPTGSYTLEAWVYVTSSSATQTIFAQGTGVGDAARTSLLIESSGGAKWAAQIGGTQAISSITPVLNAWTYVAMTYNGSTLTLYVNGSSAASASVTQNASNTTLKIGANWGAYNFTGYISNARVSNTVRTISIPTAPFTSDANTSLLANFTNAGIYDNAMMADLETVGNAQVSTSVKKFGTGSIYLDGNGDYLSTPDNPSLQLGTGNFTIECWVYPLSVNGSNANPLINKLNGGSNTGWLLGMSSTSLWQFSTGSSVIVRAGAVSLNTWTHLAAVRSSGTTTLYVNGTSVGSTATAFNFTDTVPLRIGWESSFVYCNAYVDDLRITKGYARYTSNFTPPAAAFPNQ